jgi:endoglucanase
LNTSHWLSQTDIRGEERAAYMQERDFKKIAEMGFDHVRIPIDEEQMWDEEGNKHPEAFKLLHNAINWAFDNNLRVIVDLHVLRSHHFNYDNDRLWEDPKAQEQFWNFWGQLSDELSQYPNHLLAYELMNEAVADDAEDWNKLIAKGIETVRQKEPERTIVVGSNRWQQVYTFPELKIPENDTNIMLSFHFYEPFIITHYQVWWNSMKDFTGELQYPGLTTDSTNYDQFNKDVVNQLKEHNQYYDKNVMQEKIQIAIDYAKERNLPLYCGEFGCYPSTSMKLRKKVYADWIAVFEENNIAWAHWNYKNDFPVVDAKTLEPISELVDIMVPKRN